MASCRVWWKTTALLAGMVGVAPAHPGHGTTDPQTVTHYVTEPVHLAPMLAVMAVAAVVISLVGSRRRGAR